MYSLLSAYRSIFLSALLILSAFFQGCSSYEMARLKRMNFSDDLYTSADEGQSPRAVSPNSGINPYDDYLEDARSHRRSSRSDRLNRYDRDLDWANRFGNPLWSNPGWNYGMGGFYGCRNYMLYNPFLPPYWGMNPGFSMGWGSPYGIYRPWGYDPWLYGGAGWGMYDPWGWNSWNSPWCNNWGMNSYWGWNNGWNNGWNGWNQVGSGIWGSASPALRPSPSRAGLPGSSLPGFVQRGKSRAPARQPNSLAGGGFTGRMSGVDHALLSSRTTPVQSTDPGVGSRPRQSRRLAGTQSVDRSASGGGVSRSLGSSERSQSADVRYPYATPGTGYPEDERSTSVRSGSTGSSGSYTPRSYTPSRSGSTGSSGSYTPRSYTPSRSGSTGSSGPYTPRSNTPSRSGSTGSSGSYTPRSYTPSRSGSTGSSGPYTPRTSSSSTPSRSYTTPRSSGSSSASAPSRSSSSGYSRPSAPASGGYRPATSVRPR